MRCPVCDSARLEPFLRRERVPVHQNLVLSDQALAAGIGRGTLQLVVCHRCGFIFNAEFNPSELEYGPAYDSTQTYSPEFRGYVDSLVRDLVEKRRVQNCRVVEVGCGEGYFIRGLVEAPGAGNVGHGFDPSYVGPAVELDGRLQFSARFYDAESADTSADVVICRHVIEHVPMPVELLRMIHVALRRTSGGRVYIETPGVEWILRNRVFWDFFYEHCSYFAVTSLTTALTGAGFRVRTMERIFGDQYLWVEAVTEDSSRPVAFAPNVDTIVEQCRGFGDISDALIEVWRNRLIDLARVGGVALWGAGAKGVTLANLLDSGRDLIACVVDLNPRKVGGFIPGTGHPIVSYRELSARNVRTAIVMNPNYYDETAALVAEAGLEIALVDPSPWQQVTR